MRKDKETAINLRKLGKSYLDIQNQLGIPKSTLSDWFRNQGWSKELAARLFDQAKSAHSIRIRELNKIRGEHLTRLYRQAEEEAVEEFDLLKYHPLFIAGLMIYWGEGNKGSRNRCWIANTDPLMIELFIQFLEKICCITRPRLKAWILLYPDLDEKICKEFWTKNTSLKLGDFHKSIVIVGKHKTKKVTFGVCSAGVSNAYLKRKILIWINLIAEGLIQENYTAGVV